MIKVNNISKSYGEKNNKVLAVDHVSFSVDHGEIFGLIGPDGSGKTSIFRILTTLLLPDSGEANIAGFDLVKEYQLIRNCVGYMPGKFSLYQDLTVMENLKFFATLFGTSINENYDLIKDIYDQIEPFKNRRAGKLSGGMKQKLALCCALIHKPKVLFLDEPTTGVDAVSRNEFWVMLRQLKKQNISILVSTPYMDEAKLCDRIALMQDGKIMTIDQPQKIIADFPKTLFATKAKNNYKLLQNLRTDDEIESCFAFGEYLHLTLANNDENEETVRRIAAKYHPENAEIKKITATIEDSFIRLMHEQQLKINNS